RPGDTIRAPEGRPKARTPLCLIAAVLMRDDFVSAAIHARGRALRALASPRSHGRLPGQRNGDNRKRGGPPVSTAPVSYYIYYRVSEKHASAARQAAAAMLASLEQRTHISGHLLRSQD